MKIKNRPDDASMIQLDDWLAELRDDGRAEPPNDDRSDPPGQDRAEYRAEAPGQDRVEPPVEDRAEPVSGARPAAPAGPDHGRAGPPAGPPAGPAVRAVIGDQLRMPVMWCEMGSCISWHADPAALGEGDMRARAIGAGWRIDAFGRLACPRCQQTDPNFWTCHQVVPWDRHTAMIRTARIVAGRGEPTAITGWHLGTGKRGH
jgi:hypothetical protein